SAAAASTAPRHPRLTDRPRSHSARPAPTKMETRYAALVHARLGRGQRRPHLGAKRAPPSGDVAANTNRRRPHRSRIATNMANVAFILADLYPDSEFIKPWQRARDAGYQTTVVGLRHGVDLE